MDIRIGDIVKFKNLFPGSYEYGEVMELLEIKESSYKEKIGQTAYKIRSFNDNRIYTKEENYIYKVYREVQGSDK